jgi:hypothetical protein
MISQESAILLTLVPGGLINDVLLNGGLLTTSQQLGKHSNVDVRC